jgi:hypothetical protein
LQGVGIKCKVDLTVREDQRFSIKIEDAQFVRVNNVLEGNGTQTADNWRLLRLPTFSDIPEEYLRSLREPIVFRYRSNGQFEELIVDQNEPEWSINFKKALVALFQTKYEPIGQGQPELQNNRVSLLTIL